MTGAGVSAASGIATFRGSDPAAIWNEDDVRIATAAYFAADPAGQWRWYLDRFDSVLDRDPNAAHRALVDIEREMEARGGRFLVVTQNVDPLHERAGQRNLVKVHGTADRFRCSADGCELAAPSGSIPREEVDLEPFRQQPEASSLPRCPRCNSLLRPHALLFDELYDGHRDYGFDRLRSAASESSLVLFAGTSLAVGATELVLRAAWDREVPVLSVDPAGRRAGVPDWLQVIAAPAEEFLPRLAGALARAGASESS